MDDATLLNQYVLHHSQEAFSDILRRYAGLVYSSARRQLSDTHLAEDVTQAVFLTLAKKAAALPPDIVLSSWLLTATRYAASNARVVESRRRHHETKAAAMAAKLTAQHDVIGNDGWSDIAPALDEALAELPSSHRDALVLRYFGERSLAQVAAALRITEDAAKQRVSRAVRQLRAALGARGVTVSPASLSGALAVHALLPAPPAVMDVTLAAMARSAASWGPLKSLTALTRTGTGRVVTGSVAAAVAVTFVGFVIAFAMRAQDVSTSTGGIVYDLPGTGQVTVVKDQTYRKVGGNAFWFDVYRPAGKAPAKGWPFVLLIHGGPVPLTSHPKDWPAYRAYGRVLGASGVAAVTFNYRFATPDDLPVAASDIAGILEHLRAHASEYDIDPDRVCLWAFSGGGPQLAAAVRDRPKSIRCLVSFYAPLDTGPGQERYSPRAQLAAAPPAEHIAPMLIARMGNDSPQINRQIDAFVAEAKRRGEPVEVVDYPQGMHAFDIDQNTNESRDVIKKAIAFVKRHLGPVTRDSE